MAPAQKKQPLPRNFVHLRCTPELTEALDLAAAEHGITRSEVVRIILELHLYDDARRIVAHEGITQVRQGVRIATGLAFQAFRARFDEALQDQFARGFPRSVGVPRKHHAPLEIESSFEPDEDAAPSE